MDSATPAAAIVSAVRARRTLAEALFDTLRSETYDGVGITRASYGPGEQFAHELLRRRAGELGLETATDAAGNSYMTLPGRERSARRTVIGSHLDRSEEHTSELQSLMRISYAVFCLKKKTKK